MTKQAKICIIILSTLVAILLFLFVVQKIVINSHATITQSQQTKANPAIENVTLYISPRCSYCIMAKSLLNKYDVEYDVIDISESPALRQKLIDETQQKTVPIIFINDKFIGGYTQLLELEQKGFFKSN